MYVTTQIMRVCNLPNFNALSQLAVRRLKREGLAFKECAKMAVDAALAEMVPLIPVKPSVQTIRQAFNKDGEEVPYAVEDGDFTFCLPIGFTLTKEKNHARKRNTHA